MPTQVVLICAESNMLAAARRAASQVADVHLRPFLAHDVAERTAEVQEALASADVLVASMVNVEADAARLRELLAAASPAWVFPIHCEPDLLGAIRLGKRETTLLHDPAQLGRAVQQLREAGVHTAPVPAALLATLPRALREAAVDGVLAPLRPYAVVAALWQQASETNLVQLFAYLAALTRSEEEPPVPPIDVQPAMALWHPAAPRLFTDSSAYLTWYRAYREAMGHPAFEGQPWVGLILFRQLVLSGDTAHYQAVIEALETRGIGVIAGFAGLDNTPLLREHFQSVDIELLLNLTGFNLVGSMAHPDPEGATEVLQEFDVPYLVASPLLFQTQSEWRADPLGLAPTQTALQVVLPELEGGLEPRVIAGRTTGDALVPLAGQVERLANRIARWITLRRKPIHERRIAISLFSFPPDKGAVGTAAYLDVFASLHQLLQALQRQGYNVGELPDTPEALCNRIVRGDSHSSGTHQALATPYVWVSPGEYRRLVPYSERLEAKFGAAPGNLDTDGRRIAIRGASFGNVFVGVQPSFGYEGDPMRLLFSPDASPSHSFAAYYGWLEKGWGADVLLHFGTHGALEFMPGKQVGLTESCYPELLVGSLPHLYYYSLNNPSEASIAKRRGGAVTISYLSPPLSSAGLYNELVDLRDAIDRWYTAPNDAARNPLFAEIITTAASAHFEAELKRVGFDPARWSDELGQRRSESEQQPIVSALLEALTEIESRLIPIGLHVTGRPLPAEARAAFLRVEANTARPEKGLRPLTEMIAEALPEGDDVEALTEAIVGAIADSADGEQNGILERLAPLLPATLPSEVQDEVVRRAEQLATFATVLEPQHELPALLHALEGGYIAPSPGGDPARTPEVLPSGRNLHALDPYRIPTPAAAKAARHTIEQLVQRLRAEQGDYPESIALVLWGTDNIKTGGEGVAQALRLLGVEAIPDSLGRKTRLRLIPLSELGRPRIDVVMTVSGIFRDLFPTVLELLDQAVRLAASADEPSEMNYVRRKTLRLAQSLAIREDEAAVRIFSNAAGMYGTGVNHLVESSDWGETADLADLFVERKGYAYGSKIKGAAEQRLFAAALEGVGATLQNLDSAEIGPTDVDHYFEYLGGLTAAVEMANGAPTAAFLIDPLEEGVPARPLDDVLRLDARTRLLNPKWYEALLRHGYQGVSEIAARLDHVFGWSATTQSIDDWVYEAAADTYLLDDAMHQRLSELNSHAVQRITQRLLEAHARGFWQADPERLERLQSLSDQFVEELEGFSAPLPMAGSREEH